MKTLVNFLFVLTLSLCSFGQTTTSGGEITYQVIEDNPESANTNFIAPELGLESNSTDLGVFLGASARKSILKGLTFEGNARYDVVSLNAESVTFQLEGGVFLPLMTKEKSKEVPVFLSYNPYAGRSYEDNKAYNIEETKYVKIPSGKFKNPTAFAFPLPGGESVITLTSSPKANGNKSNFPWCVTVELNDQLQKSWDRTKNAGHIEKPADLRSQLNIEDVDEFQVLSYRPLGFSKQISLIITKSHP